MTFCFPLLPWFWYFRKKTGSNVTLRGQNANIKICNQSTEFFQKPSKEVRKSPAVEQEIKVREKLDYGGYPNGKICICLD